MCVLIFRRGLLSDRITVSRYGLFFQDDGNRQQTARRLRTVTRPAFRPFRKYDNMTHEVVKYAGKKVTLDRTFVVFEGSEVVL